jgi:hypothetical protein
MKFKDIAKMFILGLVLVLSACSSGGGNPNPDPDPDPDPVNALAGTYNGDLAEDVTGNFSLVTFKIDSAGNLTGTTTAKDASDAPEGEKGTITGKVTLNASSVEANITLESPSLGTFTIEKMLGTFGLGKLSFGYGAVKDENGTFLGTSGVLVSTKE